MQAENRQESIPNLTPNSNQPTPANLKKMVGLKLESAGKPQIYDPGDLQLKLGDWVVSETINGLELGQVIEPPAYSSTSCCCAHSPNQGPFLIQRLATPQDFALARQYKMQAEASLEIVKERIECYGLAMKVLGALITLDGNRIIIEFSSPQRVNFRELVRDLAGRLKKLIKLHQVGPRDRSTITGGLGICGRPICCSTWLHNFSPIAVKMAKTQGISLTPSKISGVCGYLMCCLEFEYETYNDFQHNLPQVGDTILYRGEPAEVKELSLSHKTITLSTSTGGTAAISASEAKGLKVIRRSKNKPENSMYYYADDQPGLDSEAETLSLAQLEAAERQDTSAKPQPHKRPSRPQ